MKATLLIQLLLLGLAAAAAQPWAEGKWAGHLTLPDGAAVKLHLNVSRQGGQLKMLADVVSSQTRPQYGTVDFEETEPSLDGNSLSWKLRDPRGAPVLCRADIQEDGSAKGSCQIGELSAPLTLRRDGSNPWVAQDFTVASSSDQGAPYLEAVAAAVRAFGSKDFEAFDALFTPNTVGMQPNEIYQAAFRVAIVHGTIRKLEFVELDGDSARLRMHLGETTRDFIVQLEEDGKIRELTYVPPDQRHLNDQR